MDKLPWLEKYSRQSTKDLLALEGKYRIDSIIVAFDQAIGQKAARIGEVKLNEEEIIISAIESLESEVNNGGYSQYFVNYSKEYAAIIINALNRIGCERVAVITKNAIECLNINGQVTTDAIDKVMSLENEERDKKLSELDNQYYNSGEDIAGKLFEFIKNNVQNISIP